MEAAERAGLSGDDARAVLQSDPPQYKQKVDEEAIEFMNRYQISGVPLFVLFLPQNHTFTTFVLVKSVFLCVCKKILVGVG